MRGERLKVGDMVRERWSDAVRVIKEFDVKQDDEGDRIIVTFENSDDYAYYDELIKV